MTEEQLQSKCIQWFWNTHITHRRMLFHVDNNSWNAIVGAKKKALGVVQGPSDLVFVCPNGLVMFLEAKVGKNTQSPEQLDFEAKLIQRGHFYRVFRTFEEFQSLIKLGLDENY